MNLLQLDDKQIDAINKLKNGCILCGDVGSGKSRTAIGYFFKKNGGDLFNRESTMPKPKDLYIITTARKRDTFEWEPDLISIGLSSKNPHLYFSKVVVDSWNNIQKYSEIQNAFFIFDEQRVIGYGTWVKSFLKIAKANEWILLTATPGDTWMDYIPVFIANGFYKNKSEFIREHVVYSRNLRYPKVERYFNTSKLQYLRDQILVGIDYRSPTEKVYNDIFVTYDMALYKRTLRYRFNFLENKPIENASEFCYILRKIVNSSPSRQLAILEIIEEHPKVIIFYNFDYELDILKNIYYGDGFEIAEWNGHLHEKIPDGDKWIYLVQYTAGAEGWNCIQTDTMIFYSLNYSYKIMKQSSGRIDRRNTPFKTLYYYMLKSKSSIDMSISRSIENKRTFSESAFFRKG